MRTRTERAIAEVDAGHQRVAAALYALDSHPTHTLLRGVELRGATAELCTGGRADHLWAGFAAAREVLERLRSLGGRSRDAEAAGILGSAVPVDPSDGLPALPPAAFVAELERRCVDVIAGLDRIAAAAAALTGSRAECDASLAAAAAEARRLGSAATATIERFALRIRQAYADAMRDPLSDAEPGWPAIRAELDHTVRQLAALVELRAALPDRLARLDDLLDALAAAERTARHAHTRALEKITRPGLPDHPDAHGRWQARVTELVRASDGVHPDDLPALDRRVTALHDALVEAVAGAEDRGRAAAGLLERRDELRGRLEAFVAKATRLGRVEEPALSALGATARGLLWSSPCDLRAATTAVYAYQQALSGTVEGSAT